MKGQTWVNSYEKRFCIIVIANVFDNFKLLFFEQVGYIEKWAP